MGPLNGGGKRAYQGSKSGAPSLYPEKHSVASSPCPALPCPLLSADTATWQCGRFPPLGSKQPDAVQSSAIQQLTVHLTPNAVRLNHLCGNVARL